MSFSKSHIGIHSFPTPSYFSPASKFACCIMPAAMPAVTLPSNPSLIGTLNDTHTGKGPTVKSNVRKSRVATSFSKVKLAP